MPQDERKYTKPELREQLKEQIQREGKGGRPGQWSARKSQLLVQEYERAGGGYRGEKDQAARSLDQWTKEDWQTAEGNASAHHGQSMSRYLPKKVWDMLSEKDRKEAERSKARADKSGEQHVDWPPAVREAMQQYRSSSGETREELYRQATTLGIRGRSKMNKAELQKAVGAAK